MSTEPIKIAKNPPKIIYNIKIKSQKKNLIKHQSQASTNYNSNQPNDDPEDTF